MVDRLRVGDPRTVVVYGAARWDARGKRWDVTPNKMFAKFLHRHHRNVQYQDEAYSSQVHPPIRSVSGLRRPSFSARLLPPLRCPKCCCRELIAHQLLFEWPRIQMSGASIPQAPKPSEGQAPEPTPPPPQPQVQAGVAVPGRKRFRRHRRKGTPGYGLKICSNQQILADLNRAGQAIVVDRDVNAAKNILHLGLRRQLGLRPLRAFERDSPRHTTGATNTSGVARATGRVLGAPETPISRSLILFERTVDSRYSRSLESERSPRSF